MQFRLVSTTGNEEQLWVGEYREEKGQILNLYNRVTKQIAKEVHIELTAGEEQTLSKDRTADQEAIDDYIKSHAFWGDLSVEAFDKAEEFLIMAMEKDPEWSALYAAMAMVWVGRMQMGMVDTDTGRRLIRSNIEQARELDSDYVDSHFINGIIYSWPEWEWEEGERELRQAITLEPNHIMARMYYAHLLMILQRMDEALVQGKLALDLDPKNPLFLSLYSVLLKGAGRYQEVVNTLDQALEIDPDHSFTHGQMARAYYNLGAYERNLELEELFLSRVTGRENIPDLISIYQTEGRQTAYKRIVYFLEQSSEFPESNPLLMSRYYYWAGENIKALDALERSYQLHNPNMPYIGTGQRYEALHDSARFLAILDNMNLPHPKPP